MEGSMKKIGRKMMVGWQVESDPNKKHSVYINTSSYIIVITKRSMNVKFVFQLVTFSHTPGMNLLGFAVRLFPGTSLC